EPFQYLSELENVYFIESRMICNWGGFSFVKAVINALKEVLEIHPKFDYYNLMSGQDYPIKPVREIAAFLEKNTGKSFISYDEDHQTDWWSHAVSRYEDYHLTDLTFKGRYVVQRMLNAIMPKRKFPLPVKLYGSSISSWWTLHASCAQYLVDFATREHKLNQFMKYTWGADEFFYATILMNSPHQDTIVNNNLRLITWADGLANPVILTQDHIEIIQRSDKLFARKFDIHVDAEILGDIDQLILQNN
ncbi:MAG: glycosyltransferase, partial [Pedobacter sp.]